MEKHCIGFDELGEVSSMHFQKAIMNMRHDCALFHMKSFNLKMKWPLIHG